MMFRRQSNTTSIRGQALVEMAVITPVLLLLVAGAIDLGRVWYGQITITNAAREGALEGAVNPDSYQAGQPCDTNNRIVCRAVREASESFITVAHTDVTMTCDAACVEGTAASPNTVTVRVQGKFSLITPIIGAIVGQEIELSSTATATISMTPTIGAIPIVTPTPVPTATPTPSPTPTATPGGGSPAPTPVGATPTPSPAPTPVPCAIPVASFTVNPSTGVRRTTTFNFTDTTLNPGGSHCDPVWSWSFGDGGQASGPNPSYVYWQHGTYTVTLVVSNSVGTSQQFEREIRVTNR